MRRPRPRSCATRATRRSRSASGTSARWSTRRAAGPFDHWPCQRGFDRFYGFLDGETDQFHPELVADNHFIDPPKSVAEGYHLSEDLVDQSIKLISDTKGIRPDKPFFLYLAFGAMHAPHQAPQEYLDKYRGRYDEGWDVARERWFAEQKERGLVPPDTELAPRNPGVDAWDDLSDNAKALAARLQEAFAGFLDHTDDQIGRLVSYLDEVGELDNTVIMLLSDNGASQEGGPFGVLHEWKFFNFIIETPDEAVARIDDIGGPNSHSNYPWGWAQAGNTPFKWYKQNTHEGGVHVPFVVQWPARLADRAGELRHQFHHVTDIVPTIYEAAGVTPPEVYRGYEQMPIAGTSMVSSWDAAPDAPSAKPVQYFEMMGHRGIWQDGWKAVTRHLQGTPFDDDQWELYHVEVDRSECHDLAAEEPEKLARARRPLVGAGRGARRAAARRPWHRAVRRALPRRLAAPRGQALHLPPADVVDARAGGRVDRRPELGPRRDDRACRGRQRRALRDRHGQLRRRGVRPGREAGARLQRVRHPPRRRVRPRGAGRRVDRRRAVPSHREEAGPRDVGHRRRGVRARSTSRS